MTKKVNVGGVMAKAVNQDRTDIIHEAEEAIRVLAQAAEAAATRLAGAANDATKLVASAASDAVKLTSIRVSDDHDLLIQIDTQMKALIADIKELKEGTAGKIENHEMRLVKLELSQSLIAGSSQGMTKFWGWIVGGILALVALATFILPRIKL